MAKLERGQAGIAGEYAVMSQLILNGFAVGMTGGNSKEIDLLCRDIESGRTTNIQVKTQSPDVEYLDKKTGDEHFAFMIGIRDKKDASKIEKLKCNILDKQIYYAFFVARNNRVFIATPKEVVSQIDVALEKSKNNWLYFRIADDKCADSEYLKKQSNYDFSVNFEGEKGWDKLR